MIGTMFLHSCQTNDSLNGSPKVTSSFNATRSHNMGQNCMSCHRQGESGEGWFTVAGTLYDSTLTNTLPNKLIWLYSGADGSGQLIATLEVDGRGNFFTTDSIDFSNGLFTGVEGTSKTFYMENAITTGNCNSCHGVSTDRIWVK